VRDVIFIVLRYPLIFVGLFFGGLLGLLMARCVSGTVGVTIEMVMAKRLTGVGVASQLLSSWRALAATASMAAAVGAVSALAGGAGILALVLIIVAGGITYLGVTLALWWATGKPAGPEREAVDILLFVRRRAFGH
jgi:hypothetical protein